MDFAQRNISGMWNKYATNHNSLNSGLRELKQQANQQAQLMATMMRQFTDAPVIRSHMPSVNKVMTLKITKQHIPFSPNWSNTI